MEIIVDDISSYIKDVTSVPRALAIVRDVCRARPSGFKYMPRYKNGLWDGYISLMLGTNRFPTGLLSFVTRRLKSEGFNVSLTYASNYESYDANTIHENMLSGVVLRDYQLEAIRTLLSKKRGIAKMATNAGKTEVMAGIIKALNVPKTMVLVNRKELMYQTCERFINRGIASDIGMIGDGVCNPGVVTVAMLQTLYTRLKSPLLGNVLLMIDECHHTSSDRTLDVINKISGHYRFGFSGTPLKYDILADMKLVAATGRLVVEVTNDMLIKMGHSATPIVYISSISSVVNNADDLYDADYQTAYKELIVNNTYRNSIISDIVSRESGIVLILVNMLEHGRVLCSMIQNAVFVNGSDSSKYRLSVLEKMRAGGCGVYIASPIFDEGVDIPAIDTVILAGGGKSHIKLLQRIGRGMRKKDNGNVLNIYDFIDDTNKYLLNHSEERINTYVAEGFTTKLLE